MSAKSRLATGVPVSYWVIKRGSLAGNTGMLNKVWQGVADAGDMALSEY